MDRAADQARHAPGGGAERRLRAFALIAADPAAACGAALVALGAAVLAGWLLELPLLTRIRSDHAVMAWRTAVLFAMSGSALLAGASSARRHLYPLLAAAVLVLAGLILVLPRLPPELAFDSRVAPPTAIAFLLAGAAMLLGPLMPPVRRALAVRALAFAVGAIGLLGLGGYLVRARLLFPDYPFAGMALHTAAGLLVLAFGLSRLDRRFAGGGVRFFARDEDRITFVGAAVLAVATLAAGTATFAVLADRVQGLVREDLQGALGRSSDAFRDFVLLRESIAQIAATRPTVARNLRAIRAGRDDGANLANVRAVADGFAAQGFSAIAYHDADGRAVASRGRFAASPALVVPLATPQRAELLWDGGLVLRHRIEIRDSLGKAGELAAEQPLPVLTRLTSQASHRGESWDMGLCVQRGERLACFPQRLNPHVFTTPLANAAGAPLPMARAVRGEKGTLVTTDYREQNVVAAFGPVHELGLGMVLKVDTAEIFRPIRDRLAGAALLTLLFIAGGTLLLRAIVRPMLGRELGAREARLLAMTQRLVALQEKERRDIARELHDRVGQNLAALSINLEQLAAPEAASQRRIEDSRGLVRATAETIANVLTELKPPMLASYGLLDAVEWHARAFSARTGIAVAVEGSPGMARPPAEIELALFRIAQSALNNVAQHARAKSARVSLERAGARVRFEVGDDGVGFDAAQALAAGRWGLSAMRERAEAIGASFRIESSPGLGARIIVELEPPQ